MATNIVRALYANRGIALMLVSSILWSVYALGIKLSTKAISPWILCFVYSLTHLPFLLFIRWEKSDHYNWLDAALILFAGLTGNVSLCFATLAFSLTAIGNASAIIFSKPLICLLLEKVFLREKPGLLDVCLTIANLIGVVLISKPQFIFGYDTYDVNNTNLWGSLFALMSAVCESVQFLFIRKLVEKDAYDPSLFLFADGGVGYMLYGFLLFSNMTSHDHMKTLSDWFAVLLTSSAAVTAGVLGSLALKSQSASVMALVGTTEVPVSYLLQVVFTENALTPTVVVGSLLILAAPVWYSVKGMLHSEQEDGNEK